MSISNQDFFQLFRLPMDYKIDKSLLTDRYRQLQQQTHPDRFANATDQERRIALQQATYVNEAFATLKDPIRRGQYLLELHNPGQSQHPQTVADGAFLMQQMEFREELDSLRGMADPFESLDRLIDKARHYQADLEETFAECFPSGKLENVALATETVSKMQFFEKLVVEAESLEAELEDAV